MAAALNGRIVIFEGRTRRLSRLVTGMLQRDGYAVNLVTDEPRSLEHDALWEQARRTAFELPKDTRAVLNLASDNFLPSGGGLTEYELWKLEEEEAHNFGRVAELVAQMPPQFRPIRMVVASSVWCYPALPINFGPVLDESFRGGRHFMRSLETKFGLPRRSKERSAVEQAAELRDSLRSLSLEQRREYLLADLMLTRPSSKLQQLLRTREQLSTLDFDIMETFSPEDQAEREARWSARAAELLRETPGITETEARETAAVEILASELYPEEEAWIREQTPEVLKLPRLQGLGEGEAWNATPEVRELALNALSSTGDLDVTFLRLGNLLSPEDGFVGVGNSLGFKLLGHKVPDPNPLAPFPWIHELDAARAILVALTNEEPLHGPVNAVAPQLDSQSDFMDHLSEFAVWGGRGKQRLKSTFADEELPEDLPSIPNLSLLDLDPEAEAVLRRIQPYLDEVSEVYDGAVQTLHGPRVRPTRLQQLGFQWEYSDLRTALECLQSKRSKLRAKASEEYDALHEATKIQPSHPEFPIPYNARFPPGTSN